MRTRFLTTDYFTSAPTESETLAFLRLPLPDLPPPAASTSGHLGFDDVTVFGISLDIERLPIDHALSKFFSDVVPRTIKYTIEEFSDTQSTSGRSDEQRNCTAQGTAEVRTSQEENVTTFDGKGYSGLQIMQFEIPALDLSLENGCWSQKDKMQIFSEVLDAENSADMLNSTHRMQHLFELQESIFSVDDIKQDYHVEYKADLLEDGHFVQDSIHPCQGPFPLLEVDETSLGLFNSKNMELEIQILQSIEPQHLMGSDKVMGDGKELLLNFEFDILAYLSSHCLSYQCLRDGLSCSNFSQEADLIIIILESQIEVKLASEHERPDDDSIWSMSPILFEEIQVFDANLPQFYEVFSNQATIGEAETCEHMFEEAMNFKNYNELIVCNELILVDDSFKSLPVPILSNHEEIRSLHTLLEETLAELKPQLSSASDGIYLDWHLLEEDICNSKFYTCWKMLEELDTCSICSNLNSSDGRMLVFESVFSDDSPNVAEREEKKELLNTPSGTTPMVRMCPNNVDSSKLRNHGNKKWVIGDFSSDKSASSPTQVSSLVGAMSQFNDLDFFLNPLESTTVKNQKPAVEKFTVNANMSNQKLEEVLHFIPARECNKGSPKAADRVKASSMPLPVPDVPLAMEPKEICKSMHSSPDAIIIVNTKNFDQEMIISRRSTYQKILAMEKEGTQVVERDLSMPVDLIINAAVCLAWYDCRNIGKKATAPNEASSCLPLCIENIAANVLTSLSFTFTGCILVFEGESNFLADVMEFSDELYAAAATLGIDLQLFFSFSSQMTDEITLSCIGRANKLTGGLYPKMTESESLAESFLTAFPSINPLSAHAILSSGGMLVEFLAWSYERRIRALQKFHVPYESVGLLSAVCKFGEREDCKSGMTDCSSSVSSPPDSGYSCFKSVPEKRKWKQTGNSEDSNVPMAELSHFKPTKLFEDGRQTPTRMSMPCNSWIPKDPENFDEILKSTLLFNDHLSGQVDGSSLNMVTDTSSISKTCDINMPKGHKKLAEKEILSVPVTDKLFGQKQGQYVATMSKLAGRSNCTFRTLPEDFVGEVIDVDDRSPSGEDYPVAKSAGFSPLVPEKRRDPASGIFKAARKLSFDTSSLRTFPTAAEVNSCSDAWISASDIKQTSREGISQFPDIDFDNDNMPLKYHKSFPDEGKIQKAGTSFYKPPYQEKNIPECSGTPLSNAIHFAQPQHGSPWTIEFLNKVREKSRLRQQSLPRELSAPCFGYSGNFSMGPKRKSPSVLDFYKYQGQSSPIKITPQKRQKRCTQPSSSSKKKNLPSFLPTSTPIDKRARQTLSFSSNGSKGQSKLVWSDQTAQNRGFSHCA